MLALSELILYTLPMTTATPWEPERLPAIKLSGESIAYGNYCAVQQDFVNACIKFSNAPYMWNLSRASKHLGHLANAYTEYLHAVFDAEGSDQEKYLLIAGFMVAEDAKRYSFFGSFLSEGELSDKIPFAIPDIAKNYAEMLQDPVITPEDIFSTSTQSLLELYMADMEIFASQAINARSFNMVSYRLANKVTELKQPTIDIAKIALGTAIGAIVASRVSGKRQP